MEEDGERSVVVTSPLDADGKEETGLIANDDLVNFVEEEATVAKDINENLSDAAEGMQFEASEVDDNSAPPADDSPQLDDDRLKEDLSNKPSSDGVIPDEISPDTGGVNGDESSVTTSGVIPDQSCPDTGVVSLDESNTDAGDVVPDESNTVCDGSIDNNVATEESDAGTNEQVRNLESGQTIEKDHNYVHVDKDTESGEKEAEEESDDEPDIVQESVSIEPDAETAEKDVGDPDAYKEMQVCLEDSYNADEPNPLQTTEQEEVEILQEQCLESMEVDLKNVEIESFEEKCEPNSEKSQSDDADSDSDVQILTLNDQERAVTAQPVKPTGSSTTSTSTDGDYYNPLTVCGTCKMVKVCLYTTNDVKFCSLACQNGLLSDNAPSNKTRDKLARSCRQCHANLSQLNFISWQTFDFCQLNCLSDYQSRMPKGCSHCGEKIPEAALQKFCLRFDDFVQHFCRPSCAEKAKTKRCCFCHNFVASKQGFLSMVGDKGPFKQFCSKQCVSMYHQAKGKIPPLVASCAVCGQMKPVAVEVLGGDCTTHKLCSEPCLAAFKFVNDVSEGQCATCKKYFANAFDRKLIAHIGDSPMTFCGTLCLNLGFLAKRKTASCNVCKMKKFNFDMIKQTNKTVSAYFCSPACLNQFDSGKLSTCEECKKSCVPIYNIQFDGIHHFFCSFMCATIFKNQSPGLLQAPMTQIQNGKSQDPVAVALPQPQPTVKIVKQVIVRPDEPKSAHNKATLCKPATHNMGTNCRPMTCVQETQTDASLQPQMLIPVPVPIYVPAPLCMYSAPYPVPVPFPLPIPVPIFIPTTRNSSKGILKEIRKIQDKMPTDPFEAELLMMAEMVAGDKKQDVTDSESDGEVNDTAEASNVAGESFSPEAVDTSNAFGEDMLQMALKMATELDEPAVDMESVLTSNTITPSSQPTVDTKTLYGAVAGVSEDAGQALNAMRGRKRSVRGGRGAGVTPSKRGRRSGGPENTLQNISNIGNIQQQDMSQAQRIEVEKPDAHMQLKYTLGVNAWRHWVVQKNAELEKAMLRNRKIKPFKPDLLQLTADELNFSLCLFVKEVKKPNQSEYAPDTIYYLCLGIQQYLFENGRIDNIFTDSFYEKFTDCLDEVAKKFQVLFNDARYIVTRVEEEHLWESKQLGAHSPHVLLSTLMFFNTKHFNLVTVEEHMQLSFSHIMKHWKRNPNSPGVTKVPGSRNVLLRFYPPQSALEANSRKKKVYEQQENEENPLRCPVKLYEFYLSKCPESVKTRNDVFYLLPERSCVPDSPVWYSTMALGKEPLMKMLHRIKMVKEINVALLSS